MPCPGAALPDLLMLSPETKAAPRSAPVCTAKPGKARLRMSQSDLLPDQNAVRTCNHITTRTTDGMEFDSRILKQEGRPRGPGPVGAQDVHRLNIADSTRLVNSMRAQRQICPVSGRAGVSLHDLGAHTGAELLMSQG